MSRILAVAIALLITTPSAWPEWAEPVDATAVALKRGGDDGLLALKRGGDDGLLALKRGGDDGLLALKRGGDDDLFA